MLERSLGVFSKQERDDLYNFRYRSICVLVHGKGKASVKQLIKS